MAKHTTHSRDRREPRIRRIVCRKARAVTWVGCCTAFASGNPYFHPGLRKANTKRRLGGFPRNRSIAQPDELRGCSDHLPRPEQDVTVPCRARDRHAYVGNKVAQTSARLDLRRLLSRARSRRRLRHAPASLGQSAAWAALAGHRGAKVSHIGVPGQSPVPQQPVPQQMDRCRWAGGVPAQSKPPWQ